MPPPRHSSGRRAALIASATRLTWSAFPAVRNAMNFVFDKSFVGRFIYDNVVKLIVPILKTTLVNAIQNF